MRLPSRSWPIPFVVSFHQHSPPVSRISHQHSPSGWPVIDRFTSNAYDLVRLELTVTDLERDLLRASLPTPPAHPRALVTVLEGMALRRPVESPTRGRKAKRKAAEATRKVEEAKNRELRKKLEQSKK